MGNKKHDNEEQINVFALLPVFIEDQEMQARPIEFEFDVEKNPLVALRWESVHPKTGELLQFGMENLVPREDGKYDYSETPVSPLYGIKTSIPGVSNDCPFQDPVELGLFKI